MVKEQGGADQNEHQRTRDRLEHQLTTLREDKDRGQHEFSDIILRFFKFQLFDLLKRQKYQLSCLSRKSKTSKLLS